jgi:NAD(P)-dependent dehydrogenase (short-subunit alcohol dehydrogenase family)
VTPGAASPGAVLITGASTGIGRACALHLDSLGWHVFAGVRKAVDAESLSTEASPRLEPVTLDITQPDSISTALAQVGRASPDGLRGLVNNAGTTVSGPLEFLPLDALREQLEINAVAPVAVAQAALELLRLARGRVINMSSVGGRTALPFLGAYNASKFALEAITDAMRRELRPWGIEVVAIEPGSIATPIWTKGQAQYEDMQKRLPERFEELYGRRAARMAALAQRTGERGLPPEAVARTVARALTARRPRSRYLVGREARVQVTAFRVLPDRVIDRLLDRFLAG